jgi:8-oxo-dGTP pyrophosphatase MutT (NUDIX family)
MTSNYTGKVTATKFIITNQFDSKILVVRSATHWSLPGGKLERGEDPYVGGFRELQEELGLTIDKQVLYSNPSRHGNVVGRNRKKCPNCGSLDIAVYKSYEKPPGVDIDEWDCQNCAHCWYEEQSANVMVPRYFYRDELWINEGWTNLVLFFTLDSDMQVAPSSEITEMKWVEILEAAEMIPYWSLFLKRKILNLY